MATRDSLRDRLRAQGLVGLGRELLTGRASRPPHEHEAGGPPRPAPPEGASNLVVVVLDSCRFDTFAKAAPATMLRLGELERRYSYATWTAPSHYNLLSGLLPHASPPQTYASEVYKKEFRTFADRLRIPAVSFAGMIPRLWLPDYLRNTLGYHTQAMVSMPVLNPATPLSDSFDSFVLMDRHNDMAAMLDRLVFPADRPSFVLLNVGETHYPYATPDEPESAWPRIHGLNGVFKELDASRRAGMALAAADVPRQFDQDKLDALRARQVDAVRYLDGVVAKLFDLVPDNTWITITSDHGELFGEGGYFGHGPILHDKVLEVPLLEGRLR